MGINPDHVRTARIIWELQKDPIVEEIAENEGWDDSNDWDRYKEDYSQ